jgi:hypothetical protein
MASKPGADSPLENASAWQCTCERRCHFAEIGRGRPLKKKIKRDDEIVTIVPYHRRLSWKVQAKDQPRNCSRVSNNRPSRRNRRNARNIFEADHNELRVIDLIEVILMTRHNWLEGDALNLITRRTLSECGNDGSSDQRENL